MSRDWSSVRAQFPALAHWTYFNSATYGMLATATQDAVATHFARRNEFACSDFLTWFDDLDQTRARIAQLIHAHPTDIAYTLNAASALSHLLGSVQWQPGDRIVTLTDEFPNQIYFAALLREKGVDFVEVPWAEFYDAVTDRTKMVLLSQVSYSTGFRPPLEQVGAWLHAKGVPLYVDATQALGALTLNVEAIRPVMVAVNCYKWMLCPNGAAFMYVSPEFRQHLEPNVVGWRSHSDWKNVSRLHMGSPVFTESAEKYEGGMPAFPSIYALDASLRMFLEIGPETIERRVMDLTRQLRGRLEELHGVKVLHKDSPISAVHFAHRDVSQLVPLLKEKRILCSARHGCLRLALHFYNDESDIDRLMTALEA